MAKKNGKCRYATLLGVGYAVKIQAAECIDIPSKIGLEVGKYVSFILDR